MVGAAPGSQGSCWRGSAVCEELCHTQSSKEQSIRNHGVQTDPAPLLRLPF